MRVTIKKALSKKSMFNFENYRESALLRVRYFYLNRMALRVRVEIGAKPRVCDTGFSRYREGLIGEIRLWA